MCHNANPVYDQGFLVSWVQDALRLYLINSPIVKGEPLRFKKEGVYAVVSFWT